MAMVTQGTVKPLFKVSLRSRKISNGKIEHSNY
jgi:hypothetical protein